MGIATLLTLLVLATAGASEQGQPHPSEVRDSPAIGATIAPALNGSDPWLLTGLRVSIPVGSRTGIDLDGGRIVGGVNAFGSIRGYAGILFRRLRAERTATGNSTYLIVGLHYLPEEDIDRFGQPAGRKHHTAAVFGYGGDVLLRNSRVAGEVGLSGGSGLMCFVTVTVQWRPGQSDRLRSR